MDTEFLYLVFSERCQVDVGRYEWVDNFHCDNVFVVDAVCTGTSDIVLCHSDGQSHRLQPCAGLEPWRCMLVSFEVSSDRRQGWGMLAVVYCGCYRSVDRLDKVDAQRKGRLFFACCGWIYFGRVEDPSSVPAAFRRLPSLSRWSVVCAFQGSRRGVTNKDTFTAAVGVAW